MLSRGALTACLLLSLQNSGYAARVSARSAEESATVEKELGFESEVQRDAETVEADVDYDEDQAGEGSAPSAGGSPGGETYKVLSYNICWGCMEADENDGSGMVASLRKECLQSTTQAGSVGPNGMGINVTKCASNMGPAIHRYYEEYGGYDFMAFQEASNFADLQLYDKGLTNMARVQFGATLEFDHTKGALHGRRKQAWVVTLFNIEKFGNYSEVVVGMERDAPDRPYLILVFDSHQVIFINIHNTQPGRKGPPKESWWNFLEEMNDNLEHVFAAKPERKGFRVMIAGDFNDLHGKLPGCLQIPWNGDTFEIHNDHWAKSCCEGHVGRDVRFVGDYVMDSFSVAHNEIPPSYNKSVGQSDHWPVQSTLTPAAERPRSAMSTCGFRQKRGGGKNKGSSRKKGRH